MGNQAALSGLSRVPRGRLFGADGVVTVCKGIFDGGEYGSVRLAEVRETRFLNKGAVFVPFFEARGAE